MATKSPFETIRLNAGGQEKSYQWYRQQVLNLGKMASSTGQVLRDTPMVTTIMPGEMYLFMYDPKFKNKLPYYDRLPLVLPFRKVPGGFYGINLHYLPYLMRFRILDILTQYAITTNEDTRVKLSWKLLDATSRLRPAKFAVKHYLNDHVKSRFYKINYKDWVTASQLPVEKFVGAQKTAVWQDANRSQQ
jgi:hypothetical protein